MNVKKNEMQAMSLAVTDGLSVTIIPNSEHEFLIPTKDVAIGYGVSAGTVRKHAFDHSVEFVENVHYVSSVTISNGAPTGGSTRTTMWTKAGVIRLGFFIKSERAKLFRDWAEQLILAVVGHKQLALPVATKRRINRLTPDRIIDILSDVCLIENHELRERIAAKVKGGYRYGN